MSVEIEGSGGDSISGGSKKERKRGIRSSLDQMVGIFQIIGMVAAIIVLVGVFFQLRDGSDKASATDSDASIMRRARLEVNYWATHGGEFPTLGLTRGDYSYNNKFCNFCGGDLEFCLAHNVTNTTTPPVELLVPGKLVARRIHEKSLCFLWYSNHVYSRPSGGFDGIFLQRIGGVDSKNGLLDALKRYETTYGCSPFQTYRKSEIIDSCLRAMCAGNI